MTLTEKNCIVKQLRNKKITTNYTNELGQAI